MNINEAKQSLCGEDLLVIDKNYTKQNIKDNFNDIAYKLLEQIVEVHTDKLVKNIKAKEYNQKMHSLISEAEVFLLAPELNLN
ncbi:MAG: hypothetical protein EBS19_15250 [Spirochaetia bacterium]|nr:hypothetical protein [Spirochaetia bacterium]